MHSTLRESFRPDYRRLMSLWLVTKLVRRHCGDKEGWEGDSTCTLGQFVQVERPGRMLVQEMEGDLLCAKLGIVWSLQVLLVGEWAVESRGFRGFIPTLLLMLTG